MTKWLFSSALALFAVPLAGQAEPKPIGAGILSCAEMNAAVATTNIPAQESIVQWAMGYLAGRIDQGAELEGETPEPFDDQKSVSDELTLHCASNETDLIIDATREISANVFGR